MAVLDSTVHTALTTLHSIQPRLDAFADNRDLAEASRTLHDALIAVVRLGIRPDRKLLHLDLTNLVQSIDGILTFQEAGVHAPELVSAQADTVRLALDMRQRAHQALRDRASSLLVHTSVVAGTSSLDQTPLDTTIAPYHASHSFHAIPCPGDAHAPLTTKPVHPFAKAQKDTFGRMVGAIHSMRIPLDHTCAPVDSVVLPAGHMLRFERGQTFLLHIDSFATGNLTKTPTRKDTIMTYLVEAGYGGMTLYGPAVIQAAPECTGVISDLANISRVGLALQTIRRSLGKQVDHANLLVRMRAILQRSGRSLAYLRNKIDYDEMINILPVATIAVRQGALPTVLGDTTPSITREPRAPIRIDVTPYNARFKTS